MEIFVFMIGLNLMSHMSKSIKRKCANYTTRKCHQGGSQPRGKVKVTRFEVRGLSHQLTGLGIKVEVEVHFVDIF